MTTLYPHQRAELDFLIATPRALLLSETGTGKTPVLMSYADEALQRDERVLWITETGLVKQAMGEAKIWLSPSSPHPVELQKAKPTDDFAIVPHMTAAKLDRGAFTAFSLVIVDEAACVGGGGERPEGLTYMGLRQWTGRAQRSVLATATPVGSAHAYDLLALLEVGQIPDIPTRRDLQPHTLTFQIRKRWSTIEVLDGITDDGLDMLIEPTQRAAIRTTVAGTGRAMPQLERHYIDVPLRGTELKAYTEASRLSGLEGHHGRQSVSRSESALIPVAADYISAQMAGGHSKIVAFSDQFDLTEPLIESLGSRRIHVEEVKGSMTARQRELAVERHRQSNAAVLVGTGAVETGLNLQHSSVLVSLVETWNPAREAQREGRIVRIGSPYDVVHHTVIRPLASIELRKQFKHDRKREVAARVLAAIPTTSAAVAA